MSHVSRQSDPIIEILRSETRPLAPLPTGLRPRLQRLEGIRAVLFDIYGTLLMSASGDLGSESARDRGNGLKEAFAAMGLALPAEADKMVRVHEETIRRHHAAAQSRGIDFPEVDIVEIWQEVLQDLAAINSAQHGQVADPRRLAAEFEARINPVWPMPGMVHCLQRLHAREIVLGVISNAQFYTPLAFPALTGSTLDELGMDEELCFYSYKHGRAKPSMHLYEQAKAVLARRGLRPPAVLYVGNDMLNDILPAEQAGFRTALFAGDARSLRRREGDERVAGVQPDLIATDLGQVVACLGL